MSLVAALIINALVYSYIEIEIMRQETRNNFLLTQIKIIDNQIAPIKDFDRRVDSIKRRVELIHIIDTKRDDSIAVMQKLHKAIPEKIYFNNISISGGNINFKGVAAGPLYIAHFLDNLRESGSIFINPVLKSNDTKDQNSYNFEINVGINIKNLDAEFESNGN